MKPYGTNSVTFRTLLAGYDAAVSRFATAARGRDAAATFRPLFEALNWAVALDDQTRKHWAPEGAPLDWSWRARVPGGDVVDAVRCARNRVHHQWADALVLYEGLAAPVVAPVVAHEWCWRQLVDLPAADLPKGKAAAAAEDHYRELLAGRPARHSLSELSTPFRLVADLLEPQLAAPATEVESASPEAPQLSE